MKKQLVTLITLMACVFPAMAEKASLSVRLSPETISLGQLATLRVTVHGERGGSVSLPDIDGLDFYPRGSSSRMSIINGNMSMSVTYNYAISPNKEGEFKLGPITADTRGGKITAQHIPVLKVVGGNRAVPNRRSQGGNKAITPSAKNRLNDIAFLQITGLKKEALVGESIPVEIRAYVKSPARLTTLKSLPTLSGGDFVLKVQDGEPRQGYVSDQQGNRYFVIVYEAALTAVKAGEFELPVFMDTTIIVPEARRGSRRSSDPFDSLLDEFFGSRGVEKDVTIKSKPFKIKVTPPPLEGRPESFDGAIGKFTISSSVSSTKGRSGDPLTMTVRIQGEGNLSRLRIPSIKNTKDWKTYPAKKKLVGANSIETSGTVVFEQIIVPRHSGVTEVPALEFSYCDPETRKYHTLKTRPIPLSISPGTDLTEDEPTEETGGDEKSDDVVAVPHNMLGWLRHSRIDESPWLLPVTAGSVASLLALALMVSVGRSRNTQQRRDLQCLQKNMGKELSNLNSAMAKNDARAFFKHARQALQHHWGAQLGISPSAVSATDIKDPDSRAIVEMADKLEFSTQVPEGLDLEEWNKRLRKALGKS